MRSTETVRPLRCLKVTDFSSPGKDSAEGHCLVSAVLGAAARPRRHRHPRPGHERAASSPVPSRLPHQLGSLGL